MTKNELPIKTDLTYLSFSKHDAIPVADILDTILDCGAKCRTIEYTAVGIVFDCKAKEGDQLKPFQVVLDRNRNYLHIQAVDGINLGNKIVQDLIDKIANR